MLSAGKIALGLMGAGLIASGGAIAPAHAAPGDDPYAGGRSFVRTIQCPVRDPWPGPDLTTWIDVWNKIPHPSDGLPGPAISLIASTHRMQVTMTPITEYTMWVRVHWHNVDNGRRGIVKVRARAPRNTWQAVLHPGKGLVKFEVHQTVEAMFVVPGVNPQTSVCRGSARSV